MNDVLILIHCFAPFESLCGDGDNKTGPGLQTDIFLSVTISSNTVFVSFDLFVTRVMFDHVRLKEFLISICHPAPLCLKSYLDILVMLCFLCSHTCASLCVRSAMNF